MPGPGYNPLHGYDTGPPPPGFHPARPQYVYPQGYAVPVPVRPVPVVYHQNFISPGFIPPPPPVYQPPVYHPPYQPIHYAPPPNLPPMPSPALPSGVQHLVFSDQVILHVLQTASPPWQTPGVAIPHSKFAVPSSVTVHDLMKNLGCNNSEAKKNMLCEVVEKGNGAWSRGLTITGDEKDKLKKKLSDFGWDKTRTGKPGERAVVWIWASKG